MPRKPTIEEINERILTSGVDAQTDDIYVNAVTPMEFYCHIGHRWRTKLGNVTHNHQGCPYCSGRYPIVGETDLWTIYPEIASLLLDKSRGYELTKASSKKEKFLCPCCGAISEHIVSNVVKRGFSCPICSDGISYPNKFAANMFRQLDVKFIHEFSFDDATYRYDFYLPEYNMIVEMHGRQHYEQWDRSSRTLEEEQLNDKNKIDFAISKNISHYIVIDARSSDIDYISKHILNSELNNIFDMSEIDWRQCGYFASGSLVRKSAELYNEGLSVLEISNILQYSDSTIRNFLKKATKLDLCKYIPSNGFLTDKHQIILLNNKEIFESISDASRKYHVPTANISKVCLHERNYAGIDPTTGYPYVWRYIEEYDPEEYIDFQAILNKRICYFNNTKLIKEVI